MTGAQADPGAALRRALEGAATVLVASEPLPDGDAFGSELAVRAMVEQAFGLADEPAKARAGRGPKYVAILNERAVPERYAFLDGAEAARAPSAEDRERVFDVAVAVDGGIGRMGPVVGPIFRRARTRVYVDHHRHGSRETYDVVLLEPSRASTTELLAELLGHAAWRDVTLTRPLAEALYTGLVTDTGAFLYSLTSPATHELASRLLAAGARSTLIGERVLLELRFQDVVLQGRVLERARLLCGGRLLVAELLASMLDGQDPATAAYDKVLVPLTCVRGVELTALLREMMTDTWKVSFRSRGGVDVAALARELDPQGGGHARAAGCSLGGALDEIRARVVTAAERRLAGPV